MITFKDLEGLSRQEIVDIAKLSEVAKRYDDVAKIMKHVWSAFESENVFNNEERDLFIIGYKSAVSERRASWKSLFALSRSGQRSSLENEKTITRYLRIVEREIVTLCNEVIAIVDDLLLVSDDLLSKTIFIKTKADYYRYLAEISADLSNSVRNAEIAYKEGQQIAWTHLSPTDPLSLGVSLNHSVFCFEFSKNKTEAIRIAQKAFDRALAELDAIPEDQHHDVTTILKIIRENLHFWQNKATL